MKKNLYEILVPVNTGNSKTIFEGWEASLVRFSGGWTKLPEVSGVWVNEGKTYNDKSIPYRVYVTEQEFFILLATAKIAFRQLSIMGYEISNNVVFYGGA